MILTDILVSSKFESLKSPSSFSIKELSFLIFSGYLSGLILHIFFPQILSSIIVASRRLKIHAIAMSVFTLF